VEWLRRGGVPARNGGRGGRDWKIDTWNRDPGIDRRERILEAGIHFFRRFFHPAPVGTLNQLEVPQLIRAYFKKLFRGNLMVELDKPVAISGQCRQEIGESVPNFSFWLAPSGV